MLTLGIVLFLFFLIFQISDFRVNEQTQESRPRTRIDVFRPQSRIPVDSAIDTDAH